MNNLRWFLIPFALLYGMVVTVRNWLYNAGVLKSRSFDLPVISVGNLDVGGAGKTPMTEYLIRQFKAYYRLATLSRGYGRSTKGFLLADEKPSATLIGDEPAQIKRKFPDITVAVCEDRVAGIERLQTDHQLIIMDDAYQHRAVKPGLSLLLFDYSKIQGINMMLPAGNRREPFIGRKRADVIIITKCPAALSEAEQQRMMGKVSPFPHQQVFFSTIVYLPFTNLQGQPASVQIDSDTSVFLLTGIAGTGPLIEHLQAFTLHINHHKYPDHHPFTLKNIAKLADDFNACTEQKKLIITTEKDAQRLGEQGLLQQVSKLPFYVLPIGIDFLGDGRQQFNKLAENYVREHRTHHRIY